MQNVDDNTPLSDISQAAPVRWDKQTHQESIMVPVKNGEQLHVRRLVNNAEGPPVLLLHGLAEDGRVYYSSQGAGLGFFLAREGFDVYAVDLRGRGRSWPQGTDPDYSAHHVIVEDIPRVVEMMTKRRGHVAQCWIGHAWGGVLLASVIARYPKYRALVCGMVHFGARRVIDRTRQVKRRLLVDGLWERFGGALARYRGVFPARRLKMGAVDESVAMHQDCVAWSSEEWLDRHDGFDYARAIRHGVVYPPSLYFANKQDAGFAHPRDVKRFMRELGEHDGRLMVLSKQDGNLRDYSLVEMLTDPMAERDHFPVVARWLSQCNARQWQIHEDLRRLQTRLAVEALDASVE